ncbi:MAG: SUMF1/EgtB/PvdO family nonheme iron enzyme [Verrucomicrobiota bacterium]
MPFSRFAFFFALLFSTVGSVASGAAAERVAFIVGVDAYDHLPNDAQLRVAVSDAERIAKTLEGLDPAFEVTLLTDVEQDAAEDAFDEFLDRAKGAECVFLYFAGHGIEYFGTNYLLMRDTDIDAISSDVNRMKRRLGNEALSLQELVDSLDTTGAKVKLVVLDCCRDNPLEAASPAGTRSVVGGRSGLAQVTPPSGTLISYSADAGQKANDGLFTAVLAEEIESSGLPILRVFASTRQKVREISTAWAAEDAAKGLPVEYRRVRHEPAEYNKLDLSGLDFTFSRGSESQTEPEESLEMIALRQQVETMRATIESLREAGIENEALREQLTEMEASVAAAETRSRLSDPVVPEMTDMLGFITDRGMEGTRAGEVRSFGEIEMVWCPPTGENGFLMGSPKDEKGRESDELQRRVLLSKGFWLAKTECTQWQWGRVLERNPSSFYKGSDNLPVENVSWEGAQEWLAKMNQAHPLPEGWVWVLPTEAQWEYACRAGTESAFHFGDEEGELHKYGNFADRNFTGLAYGDDTQDDGVGNKTAEVSRYKANDWGLHDMHGNVLEWCSDWYGASPGAAERDPSGPESGTIRVLRGGCWYSLASHCRAAYRGRVRPTRRYGYVGFRPAVSFRP